MILNYLRGTISVGLLEPNLDGSLSSGADIFIGSGFRVLSRGGNLNPKSLQV